MTFKLNVIKYIPLKVNYILESIKNLDALIICNRPKIIFIELQIRKNGLVKSVFHVRDAYKVIPENRSCASTLVVTIAFEVIFGSFW